MTKDEVAENDSVNKDIEQLKTKLKEKREQLKKEREEKVNYKKGLQSERSEKKEKVQELTSKLEEAQKTKTEIEQQKNQTKEEKEKMQKQLEEMRSEIDSLTEYKKEWQQKKSEKIKSYLNEIPEEKKDFANKLIDGKSGNEKVEILKGLAEDYKKIYYEDESKEKNKKNNDISTANDEYETLKKKVDNDEASRSEKARFREILRQQF